MTAKRLTIGNLLQVVESTCDALITVGVESIEADGSTTIAAGVNLTTVDDRLAGSINDSRSSLVVGVDEVATLVLRCIRSLYIAIAQRSLERCKRRYGLAISLELGSSIFISSLDCCLDLVHCLHVILSDDEGDAVLGIAAVDGLWIPNIHIRPAGLRTCNYFCVNRISHNLLFSSMFTKFCCC